MDVDRTRPRGFYGWSRRLAERIARDAGGIRYANLAQRGLTTREVRERQLAPALALEPSLATVFTGTNDVLARHFDARVFAHDTHALQSALRARGATVLTFTLPDLTPLLPWAAPLAPRIRAMNTELRAVSLETGTRLVDFAAHAVTTDARLWHADRIHANAAGHARIAEALAEALHLPGASAGWRDPLPPRPRDGMLRVTMRETAWAVRFLLPWTLASLMPRRLPAPRAAVLEAVPSVQQHDAAAVAHTARAEAQQVHPGR